MLTYFVKYESYDTRNFVVSQDFFGKNLPPRFYKIKNKSIYNSIYNIIIYFVYKGKENLPPAHRKIASRYHKVTKIVIQKKSRGVQTCGKNHEVYRKNHEVLTRVYTLGCTLRMSVWGNC